MFNRKVLMVLGVGAALCAGLPQSVSTPSEISARAAAVAQGKTATTAQVKGVFRGGDRRRYRKRRLGTGLPSCAAWDKRAAKKRRNRARHKAHCRGKRA